MFGVYCSSGSSSGGSSNGVVAVEPLSLSLASLLERDLRVASFLVNEYHPLFAAVNEDG